jgi:hypothetical protein
VPDEKTIWTFQERLIAVDAIYVALFWFTRHLEDVSFEGNDACGVESAREW